MRTTTLLSRTAATGLILGMSLTPISNAAPNEPTAVQATMTLDSAHIHAQAESLLRRQDLQAYRGWIKYLRLEADTSAQRGGAESTQAREKLARLADWLARIEANPNLLSELRGVQEWAYESAADGSGQPFRFAIPKDYDSHCDYPLVVYMHGYSGNHLEHSTGMASREGLFDVAVLGRSRGGGYRTLSEADVLDVVRYLQANWPIDAARIHLSGGSMGGGGTFRLASRFPQLFASGRPTCGFATHVPIGNLLSFPLYATHSADDPVVSVMHVRWPLARLRELGGEAILDETNGLGHAAWDYAEGNRRGEEWYRGKSRPDSRSVRHIDYTATDGGALRGWWVEVAEWGEAPADARVVATAGKDGFLSLDLTNLRRVRLHLKDAPFDATSPLSVSVNGAVPLNIPAPLPAELVLADNGKGWAPETEAPALPFRLHTPGGPCLLYTGEPLLIVYGTGGSEAARKAMKEAAGAASKSPNPQWLDDSGEAGTDGVPHSQLLYGHLNIKADTEVTDADLASCHLVLIGGATENRLVARMADRLPVSLDHSGVRCSDGERFDGAGLALGLVHYNPLSPSRLVYWVAGDDPSVYAAKSLIPAIMGGTTFRAPAPIADLLVARTAKPVIVAARSFGSRWTWSPRAQASRLLPASLGTQGALNRATALAIRRSAGTDLCLFMGGDTDPAQAVLPGVTRVSDLALLSTTNPVARFDLGSRELLDVLAKLEALPPEKRLSIYPAIDRTMVEAGRVYSIAFPADLLGVIPGTLHIAPPSYRLLPFPVSTALTESLGLE
jgi:poly(3-hydroxybutyrate) depolymerase